MNGGVALRVRGVYVGLALLTIVVGLFVHRGGTPLGGAARDVLGDALWAMMIVWWAGAIAPGVNLWIRGAAALALCFAVELSQRFHTPALDALRRTTVGHLMLGSGFDLRDFLAYTAGVLVAVVLSRWATSRTAPSRG